MPPLQSRVEACECAISLPVRELRKDESSQNGLRFSPDPNSSLRILPAA